MSNGYHSKIIMIIIKYLYHTLTVNLSKPRPYGTGSLTQGMKFERAKTKFDHLVPEDRSKHTFETP